jgi:hypothetical protein
MTAGVAGAPGCAMPRTSLQAPCRRCRPAARVCVRDRLSMGGPSAGSTRQLVLDKANYLCTDTPRELVHSELCDHCVRECDSLDMSWHSIHIWPKQRLSVSADISGSRVITFCHQGNGARKSVITVITRLRPRLWRALGALPGFLLGALPDFLFFRFRLLQLLRHVDSWVVQGLHHLRHQILHLHEAAILVIEYLVARRCA